MSYFYSNKDRISSASAADEWPPAAGVPPPAWPWDEAPEEGGVL